ncbi:unnamed protein product [Rotaria sordida]|uniref:Uncharacterized protein n=1 Tax=Rotaria sordida TaxID=392033 RepID=A0A815PZU9_9BILA|nr:unnamed protein product [Rotaria sordida]
MNSHEKRCVEEIIKGHCILIKPQGSCKSSDCLRVLTMLKQHYHIKNLKMKDSLTRAILRGVDNNLNTEVFTNAEEMAHGITRVSAVREGILNYMKNLSQCEINSQDSDD